MKRLLTLVLVAASFLAITSCEDDPAIIATCSDGIQNGDETGIDCGGSSCQPCSVDNLVVTGELTENTTWTSDNIYEMSGKVVVPAGITLTIEPGTIIKAREGDGSLASALVVAQGGKIMAEGTATSPIIFTSVLDNIEIGQTQGSNLDETQVGLWGGLLILGSAPISADAASVQIEGIPADDTFGLYGGSNASDNSGVLKYISIRHGGALIGEGNEINGLTLGGVGSGTTISYIEVVANKDDGIECFGGTVNVSNILVWAQGDDAYDIDQGYSGTIDNFVYIAGADSDHGLEIDGPEGSSEGRFTLTNGSLQGDAAEYADFRDGAMGTFTNSYFFNFTTDADLELDDDLTSSNYFSGKLVLTGLEFNSTNTIADIVAEKAENGDDTAFDTQMAADNSIVTAPTVGADMTQFDWTYANAKNALANF